MVGEINSELRVSLQVGSTDSLANKTIQIDLYVMLMESVDYFQAAGAFIPAD